MATTGLSAGGTRHWSRTGPALRVVARAPPVLECSTPMGSTLGFWLSFAATLLLLVIALVSGWRGRRRVHLVAGPLALVLLAIAIVCTEQLMRNYRFPEAALRFHLVFAKTGGLLALPVVVTGVWLWRRPAARPWHRRAVWLFLLGAVAATSTGIWLFMQGVPAPPK
jgi:hypothetical protein